MNNTWWRGLSWGCLVLIVTGITRGEDDSVSDEVKAWQARRVAEFAEYQVVQQSLGGEDRLVLEKSSALSWTNPIRHTAAGAVFLWTVEGRPQLISSTYPYAGGIEHEMTSLSESPMVLIRDRIQRHHFTSNITWKDVPDAEPPHKQRALRLVQMRRIAERFRVQGGDEKKFETRLLTQPVYRAPAEAKVDNAVFAFVQVTDPEAVLLIEVKDTTGWRYAFGRMTTYPITADLDEQRVWELPSCYYQRMSNDQPFRTLQYPGAK